MTRPTILDMDLVVVPREATVEMWREAATPIKRYGVMKCVFPVNYAACLSYRAALSASPYPTAWDDVRKYVGELEAENKEFRAGIKRLSDEEELCGETMPDEDAFNLVRMAAGLSAAEARNQKIMSSLNNVVMLGEVGHYVNDAIFDALQSRAHRAEAAEARIAELEAELASLAELYGDEEKPRYTTRRLRMEVERAKAAADIRIAELEKEKHAALTMIAMVEKRLADAERVISKQRAALQPLSGAVFNDNGDITVNLSMPTGEEFIAAYFADRAASAYLEGK